ncbi:VC2046/SO_2500 family protein [Succinivibrio dextrinosolvens]|uniref:VC2046/SO_2500 family protein n=1 Tax=Succinivibrio dextrinosolvens TaxID=83771 RepID=UPI0024790DB3|nr:VC2046/SO_2500 family protein [Succinivibrio dextrinosolvens]
MLTSNIRNQYLVDEMQLGERLNQDVHSNNHADFSLMLAMLSHDLTDHPLYNPKVTEEKDVNLRKKFHLLPEQKKYAQTDDFDRAQFLSESFSSDGITQVFLAQCIRKEPLTPFQRELAPEVFGELPPLKQEKLRKEYEGKALSYEEIHETGDGFDVLDEILASRIQLQISTHV